MALPDYKYGKVTGLTPDLTVVSERSEDPMVCCGYCSAHMAARTAKSGLSSSMTNEAHKIRSAGGRPHDYGNNAGELRTGAKEALGVTLKSVSIADIPGRLRDGFAVTIGVDYQDVPDWLCTQGGSFGHAVCLFGWKEDGDYVGWFDPLYDQGARGAWAKWSEVKPALWSDGNHSTTTVKLTASSSGGDMGIFFNPARWTATKDIPVYLDSGFVTKITTIQDGTTFTTLGEKAVIDENGWTSSARAIRLTTGGLVPGDSPQERAILWIKGADLPDSSDKTSTDWDESVWTLMGSPDGRFPCPPPTDPDTDHSAAIAARDAEWRAWIDAAPEGIGRAAQSARALVAWAETAPDKE